MVGSGKDMEGMRLGKYVIGKTLGEGNFGKVKYAIDSGTGEAFAVKILDKDMIIDLKITDQIKREIGTLKLLKHPNVIRLFEVIITRTVFPASKIFSSAPQISEKLSCRFCFKILDQFSAFFLVYYHLDFLSNFTSSDFVFLFHLQSGNPKLMLSLYPLNFESILEVLASKTKIYMVLEYVNGGELFDQIVSVGKFSEVRGRRLFQQLIDGVSYCHDRGVYHRDLKLENLLIDKKGNLKISDFGLSALPQHFRDDGLLHTTCGTPNYVAPEILSNRGYDGAPADVWSCGVILFVILTGALPFDDRNLVVLYQKILKGDVNIPKWLSSGAQNMIRRILDPNPATRVIMEQIKEDEWFKQGYNPASPDDDEDTIIKEESLLVHDVLSDSDKSPKSPTHINAFELIGMSSYLDLSGFFEKEELSDRKIRFTSTRSLNDLLEKIEETVTDMGFFVQQKNGKLKILPQKKQKRPSNLLVTAELFELSPSLYVVELRKSRGDPTLYRQLCKKLSSDLGAPQRQEMLAAAV